MDEKLIAVVVLVKKWSARKKLYRAPEENLASVRGVVRVGRSSDTSGEAQQKEINRSHRSAVLLHGGKESVQEATA